MLRNTHLGLSSAVSQLEKVKRKMNKIVNINKQLKSKDKDDGFKAEEAKTRLNENYILIAKLSSENLRLLGEYSKLETSMENLEKSSADNELRLQSEICALKGKLLDKEKEVERLQSQVKRVRGVKLWIILSLRLWHMPKRHMILIATA